MTATLFLGGARSGKSRLAESAARAAGGPLSYLATGEEGDAEMADRIARHRADRGTDWTTIECPHAMPQAIAALTGGAAVIDCLTLWLSNLMLAECDVPAATDKLLEAMTDARAHLFVVSNEVGWGIVPNTLLGRDFRDASGRLNQAVAAAADRVELVVAGLALRLK